MAKNEYFILLLNQNSDNGPPRRTGMALASPRLCQKRSGGNNPVAAASCRLSFTMHVFARNEMTKQSSIFWLCNTGNTNEP